MDNILWKMKSANSTLIHGAREGVTQSYITGNLHQDGDQTILTADDGSGQYPLIDPPSDVPLDTKIPNSQLSVTGVLVNGKMFWTYIQYFANANSMGGGGGGGLGFYQLNLSGTPVPFPTATSVPTLSSGGNYTVQAGDTISSIAAANGITTDELINTNGITDPNTLTIGQTLIIPSVASPEPQWQLYIGTQKVTQINDQTVILFTTEDRKTYVLADPGGHLTTAYSLIGREGDKVSLQAAVSPDKSFGDYPVLLVSGGGLAGTWGGGGSGGPSATNEPSTPVVSETSTPPTLTIEKVELVYFVSNPLYQANDPNASRRSPYIQPAWHFSGHYSNGDEFDIIVQALKQEFLSPEIAPYIQGG